MHAPFRKHGTIKKAGVMAVITGVLLGALAVFGGLTAPYIVKLNPINIGVESSGAWVEDGAAWALFDRNTLSAYAPASSPGRVMVTLPAVTDISGVKIYSSASIKLSVYDGGSGAWIAVPALQSIDLQAQAASWNTYTPSSVVRTNKLMLEFVATAGNAGGVREIEVWGTDAGDPTSSLNNIRTAMDAESILAVSPRPAHIVEAVATSQIMDVPADGNPFSVSFTINQDPKLVKRAYLLYDSYNADYPVSPEKRINGLSWTGGFVPSSTDMPEWKSHIEEINPAWLARGANKIEFRNQNTHQDPSSYFIRDVKIIAELENGWNTLTVTTGLSENAAHSGAAACDKDLTTYFELKSTHSLDLKTDRSVQPETLRINLWSAAGTPSGSITLQYLDGTQWRNFASGGSIDMSTLQEGWNDIKIPAAIATDSLRLNIQVTPDKKHQNATISGINEVELIASSVGSRPSHGLVVTYPSSGEYFTRTAYLQGFVDPATNGSGTAKISIEGKVVSNADGSFSMALSKDETRFAGQDDDDPWEAMVTATWPDGSSLSRTVALTKNLLNHGPSKTNDSGQSAMSQKEKFSDKVAPGQAKKIQYKDVTLDIPADAVDRETEITIIPLVDTDLARLNPGMINVTFPNAGYRFLPHGMKFKKPIKISFGYSKTLFAAGQVDDEVNMYYYDEALLRWQRLSRVKVDSAVSQVTSESDHFTDIINSTLVVPEHPQALTFNPNSIKDIKAADPGANIDLIEPPKGNNKGTANLSYPIEIPKGRGAYTPDVKVSYSSGNANGWMGLGWDIQVPRIQVDTRWGVPTYDPLNESETYLINGQALAPVFKLFDDPKTQRSADRRFYKRVEGDFMKIIRKGDKPTNYSWELTDKSGVKYYYGLNPQARLADYQDPQGVNNNIFQWFLEKVVDTNGNVTLYSYYQDTKAAYLTDIGNPAEPPKNALVGENWIFVYLDKITYTGNEKTSAIPLYSVQFVRDAGDRSDLIVNGKSGFKTAQRFRLDSVVVKFKDQPIRTYMFDYISGDFSKSLLNNVTVKGANGATLAGHGFEYYRIDRAGGKVLGFGGEVTWSSPDSEVLTRTDEQSRTAHEYVGLSYVPQRAWSRGKLTGFINADSDTSAKFQDLNGDGLPDLVAKNRVKYNLSGPGGLNVFAEDSPATGLYVIEKEIRRTDSDGIANYLGIGSYSEDWAATVSRSCSTMADIDGDGFVDLIVGNVVYFNRLATLGKFVKADNWTWSSDSSLPDIENYRKAHFHLVDPVRKWTAPFSGDIKITGTIKKNKREDAQQTADKDGDGMKFYLYRENTKIGELSLPANDTAVHLLGEAANNSGSDSIYLGNVQQGERIYFRVNSIDNGENDEIIFDPVITYETSGGQGRQYLESIKDASGRPLYTYQASSDFSVADTRQYAWVAPHQGTLQLTGIIQKLTTIEDVHIVIKRSNDPDPLVWLDYKDIILTADQAETLTISDALEVQAGERFLFTVTSERNVDPARVQFSAEALYTVATICGMSGDFSQYTCTTEPVTEPDKVDKLGKSLYRFQPQVNYPVYVTTPKASALTWIAPHDGTVRIQGNVMRNSVTEAFTARILGINKSLWKQSVPAGGGSWSPVTDQYAHDLSVTVAKGDQIFFEVQSEDPLNTDIIQVAWSPTITYTQYCSSGPASCTPVQCTTDDTGISCTPSGLEFIFNPPVQYYYDDPNQGSEPFGGGFREWYFGEWNGNNAWDQGLIVVREPANENDDVYADFVRMIPAPGGTAFSSGRPVWTVNEERSFVAAGGISSSRLATGTASDCGPGGVLRQSTIINQNLGGSFWIEGESRSHGNVNTQIEMFDFNGDGYPDLITPNGVTLSDGRTGLKASSLAPGTFRTAKSDNDGFSLGVGAVVNAISSGGKSLLAGLASPPGRYTLPKSIWDIIGAQVSYVRSTNSTKAELLDINGDGLPDLIYQTEDQGIIKVRLNMGNRFGEEELWQLITSQLIREGRTKTLSISLGLDVMGIAGASGSLSMNVAKMERDMIDINGDGLPDMVKKVSGDDYVSVKINQGGSFGAEELWSMPSWELLPPKDKKNLQLWSFILGGPENYATSAYLDELLFENDTLTNTTTESWAHGWFINHAVPHFVMKKSGGIEIVSWTILGLDETTTEYSLKSQVDFRDIDGDGLPDHIFKSAQSHDVQVKRNLAGQANLLKSVKRPLGGNFTLEYDRKGNKVDYSNPAQIIDMPHSQWVLAKVTLNDGMTNVVGNSKHTYETAYAYDSGYYDRQEREFYGFRTMTETRGEGSDAVTVVQTYENQDYYKKGLLASSVTRAGAVADITNIQNTANPIYVSTVNDYLTRPEADTASQFPYLSKTASNFYNVQSQTIAKSTSQEYTVYDKYGNITDYVDNGDGGAGDKVLVKIQYMQSNDPEYIWDKPWSIEVRDVNNRLYRSRSAHYEPGTGNMTDLFILVDQGKNAHWVMTYHPDGNLWTIAYPAGDPAYNTKPGSYTLTYTYDQEVSIYVTGISDSFGYASSAVFDYGFGQPLNTRDINGNYRVNKYDEFGRLTEVYGPYAVNSNTGVTVCPPTIAFEYDNPIINSELNTSNSGLIMSPASAVTTNRADSSNGCTSTTIKTATFSDGLKRIIQTKKDATINGEDGFVVSGTVEFDSLGRIVKQGQPVPGTKALGVYEELAVRNATEFAYDTLDRTVMVKSPDSSSPTGYAVTTTNYGFGNSPDGSGAMFLTQVIDPLGNPKESYKDVHDHIRAVVEHNKINANPVAITTTYAYNTMGDILSVTDAKNNTTSITYDLLGRRRTINNPDTGLTSYTYDANGNATTKETANLHKGAKLIKYIYDYNRLKEIAYPESVHVVYEYGTKDETGDHSGNLAGRVKQVTDESGYELRYYGRLGETTKELRQISATNNPVSKILFETRYIFDSFGRMKEMTYPDGEVLTYGYDHGGLLNFAQGKKRGNPYDYIKTLTYDVFGQRTKIVCGNDVATTYTYDPLSRRLSHLKTTEPTKGRVIQDIRYNYDLVGNILDIYNSAPVPTGGEIGGYTEHHYTYDDVYQLTTANGYHLPAPDKKTTYTNNVTYDIIGNITRKLQTHLIVGTKNDQSPAETNYDLLYKYTGIQPHAVTDAGDKLYTYDLNGNMLGWTSKTTNASRTITWNEENRVKNITDSGNGTTFLYDDQGERVTKRGGGNETVYVNRFYAVKNGDLGTKHVFAGETRVTTKLEKDGGSIQNGVPGYNGIVNGQGIQVAINNGSNGQKKGVYRRLNGTGTGTTGANPPIEKFEFFYHGDHLGSSSFITDDAGAVYQHLEYFPYGETWVEDGGSGQMPYYRFTGKELDPETGLYYFGARYYDPVLSRWISADPILAKYLPDFLDARQRKENWKAEHDLPGIGGVYSPLNLGLYSYTHQNPIKYIDPDGKVIKTEGSANFKKEVKTQLSTLKTTPTGKVVVESLEKSKNVFTIKENKGVSGSRPTDAKAAQSGKGTGGTIYHDPKWQPKVNTTAGAKETPSEVVLGHELHHATDYDKGTLDRSVNPSTGVRRSEEAAVATENRIRKERGIPERQGY